MFHVPDWLHGTMSSVAIVTRCVPVERTPVPIATACPPNWDRLVTVASVCDAANSTAPMVTPALAVSLPMPAVPAASVTVPSVPMLTLFVVPGVVWSMPTLPMIAAPATNTGAVAMLTGCVVCQNVPETGWVVCQNVPLTGCVAW
jgi:hypothetical protein